MLNRRFLLWRGLPLLICLWIALPLFTIFLESLQVNEEIWTLLLETRLFELIGNTLLLAVGVGVGAFFLGTSLAWLVAAYDFPGKKIFDWALILPLAMPAYVIGFVYLTSFEYGGFLAGFFESIGVEVDIRNAFGVITVMTLVLYPYVFLMARSAFLEQNQLLLEAAISLGTSRRQLFFKVALPLARPAITVGLALALMESLADFGTVALFSFDTFTTAIYEVWFGLFNRQAATQLAAMLLLFALLLFWIEKRTRGKKEYFHSTRASQPLRPIEKRGLSGWLFALYPFSVLFFGFLFPLYSLGGWAINNIWEEGLNENYFEWVFNTFFLGLSAALIIVPIALFLAYSKRIQSHWVNNIATRLASMGYALPGSVIAVGVLIPLAYLDHRINDFTLWAFGVEVGLILTGSILALLFAYSVRFMTLGFNSVDSALTKITPSMDMAARSLGEKPLPIFFKIHFPLLRTGIMTAVILVIVDVMKEMPATLLMRPFGFDTLATRVWQLTSEALAEEAALPALTIVLTGLIPVILLIRFSAKSKS